MKKYKLKQPKNTKTETSILLVIDMQYGFCGKQQALTYAIHDEIMTGKYDKVIMTCFHNERNSFFQDRLKWYDMADSSSKRSRKIAYPLSTDIIEKRAIVIRKNTYSALKSSKLCKIIEKSWRPHLYICGMDTDACILATAYEAFDYKIPFTIMEKLVISSNNQCELAAWPIIDRNLHIK